MPGHEKKGKPGEADPDPAPYLIISLDLKKEDQNKPYDPKKSYWTPDGKGGYQEGILDSDDGEKAVVICGHEVSEIDNKIMLELLNVCFTYFLWGCFVK